MYNVSLKFQNIAHQMFDEVINKIIAHQIFCRWYENEKKITNWNLPKKKEDTNYENKFLKFTNYENI